MNKPGWFSRLTGRASDGDEKRGGEQPDPAPPAATVAGPAATIVGAAALPAAAATTAAPAADAEPYEQRRDEGLRALAERRLDDAIQALARAVHLRPDVAEAHANLARAFQAASKIEAARHAYGRALEFDPLDAELRAALDALPPPPPRLEDFKPGQVLRSGMGREYEVLEVKKGGFGAVYIVREDDANREGESYVSVLKTFQARYLWSDEDRERFRREAVTWVRLGQHPNVVAATGFQQIQAFPCINLEYVKGGDLAGLLARGPLPVERALELALQFCDGMEYAHSKLGLVHRDVKPSNCLLAEDGTLMITDFGLARAFGEAQEHALGLALLGGEVQAQYTAAAGTQQYMAPEQFRVGAPLDTRTDIHAFGVMLYEMLTGDLPLIGSIGHAHIQENAAAYNVPALLLELILCCTERDPAGRPANFQVVRESLAAAFATLTGKAAAAPPERVRMTALSWKVPAVALYNLGEYAECLEFCEKALELAPQEASIWHTKGLALGGLKRFQEEEACYARSLALDPNKPLVWSSRGAVLKRLGRYTEALECLDHAIVLYPHNARLWLNKGIVLADLGRDQEALAAFSRGLEINPDDSGLWQNKAVTLADLGRDLEAAECMQRAAELDPRNDALWNNLGNALLRQNRHAEALQCYERGLEINPGDPGLWNGKGSALSYLGRHEEALAAFDRGLNFAPDDPNLRDNRQLVLDVIANRRRIGKAERQRAGSAPARVGPVPLTEAEAAELDARTKEAASHYHAKRYEEALACFSRCVELAPDNVYMWSNKAAVLQMLGRREDALACYDRGLAVNPGERRLLDGKIALLRVIGGRDAELVACYDAVLAGTPDDLDITVQKGAALYALQCYEQALQAFERCIELAPDNAAMYVNQGTALLALLRHADALAAYERAIAMNPNMAAAWQGKAAVFEALGRKEEAEQHYQRADRLRG